LNSAQTERSNATGGAVPCFAFAFASPLRLTVLLFLFLLLSSCRSAPPVMPGMEDDAVFVPMEPGGFVYVFVDVENSRAILGNLSFRGMDANDRNFRRILDSTHSAIAAVFMPGYGEPAGTRLRLAAHGRYPSGRARMAFRCSRHWRGRRSAATGDRYWFSPEGMISITVSRREALVSTSLRDASVDPFYVGSGTPIPEGFNEFRRGAILSTWIENPGAFINQRLAEMHIPLEIPAEQFFASLFPVRDEQNPDGNPSAANEPHYMLHLRIQVASEIQASGFAMVLAFARNMFVPAPDSYEPPGGNMAAVLTAILFANPTVAEGRYLHIRTDAMSAGEIALLLSRFLP